VVSWQQAVAFRTSEDSVLGVAIVVAAESSTVTCHRHGTPGRPPCLCLWHLGLCVGFWRLPNPLCSLIRFPADDCHLIPIDNVIFFVDVVWSCRLILLRLWLFLGTFGVFPSFV